MFKNLLNLFFPEVCAGCDALLLAGESVICTHCRHSIPLTNHHLNPQNEAASKFYGKIPVVNAATLCYFHKKGIVQQMIHKLKYKGHEEIGAAFGSWYGAALRSTPEFREIDVVIPVPLHKKRLRERGYNQASAFGRSLAQELGVPFSENLLVRNVYSKTQTKKDRAGRASAMQSIFGIVSGESHINKHFLIVDDVLTTGATLEACGREILTIPGAKISIICIAMSHS